MVNCSGLNFFVPFEDLAIRDASLEAHVDSAAAAAAEGTDDDDAGQAAGLLLARLDVLLDVGDQRVLVRVAGHLWQGHTGVGQLPCPVLERKSATAETCVEPKRRYSPVGIRVLQEFEI